MSTAKKALTDTRVQGHPIHPLDRLVAIAARIAEREGFLVEEDVRAIDPGEQHSMKRQPVMKRRKFR